MTRINWRGYVRVHVLELAYKNTLTATVLDG